MNAIAHLLADKACDKASEECASLNLLADKARDKARDKASEECASLNLLADKACDKARDKASEECLNPCSKPRKHVLLKNPCLHPASICYDARR